MAGNRLPDLPCTGLPLADLIAREMAAQSLTLDELAARVRAADTSYSGAHAQLVWKWRTGAVTPARSNTRRLAKALGLPVEILAQVAEEQRRLLRQSESDGLARLSGGTEHGRRRCPVDNPEISAQVRLPDLHQLELVRLGLHDVIAESAMTEASIEDWERLVERHGRATRDRPAAVLLTDLAADLAELKPALTRCRSSSGLRRLVRVSAQMAGLMCLTLIKLVNAHFHIWLLPLWPSVMDRYQINPRLYEGNVRRYLELFDFAVEESRVRACVESIGASLRRVKPLRDEGLFSWLEGGHEGQPHTGARRA